MSNCSAYFKTMLKENRYTAKSFTATYNNVYPNQPISISTVQSWCTGRRSFARTAAITVLRVAHILDDPNCGDSDYTRYAGIVYHLVYG